MRLGVLNIKVKKQSTSTIFKVGKLSRAKIADIGILTDIPYLKQPDGN